MNKVVFLLYAFCCLFGCKKNVGESPDPPPPVPPADTVVVVPAVDPPVASTIGFFLDDWQPKTFTAPAYSGGSKPAATSATVTIEAGSVITKIPRSIAGNNSNLWMTQITTETNLLNHINQLKPHIIRFPGGSISDVFFWNAQKNLPPADAPPQLTKADGSKENAGYWFGKNAESWTFSVDNYYHLLQQTNNTGMITINYGYARYSTAVDPVASAAHLAADWVRYDNGRTKYWEIGNENFGDWEAGYRIDPTLNKDGQPEFGSGQLYGKHFKVFADSMRKAAQEIGKTIRIGAVLYDSPPQSWNTNTVKTWNQGVVPEAGSSPDYYIVHSYYTPYNQQSNAGEILISAPAETKRLMEFVKQALQAGGVAEKPVALTEWNIFATGLKQQVSHINGMHGVMVVGNALKNKYGMTSRWDLANAWDNGNDHGMFNIGDEPDGVPKWNPRPAFYHLYYFQKFLGDRLVNANISGNANIETFASTFSSGQVALTMVNKSNAAVNVDIKVNNFNAGSRYYWYSLAGGDDNGEFSRKVFVNGQGPTGAAGGPAGYATLNSFSAMCSGGIKVSVPAYATVCVAIDKR
jgi:alpha-L-arabinofuranosidase